jgi:pantoate--beta-alanine ligase
MRIIDSAEAMTSLSLASPVLLVPTMGALHAGHVRLLEKARELAGEDGSVVVSLFVNPTQFGPGEDYDTYPRTPREDLDKCHAAGVDVVFHPSADNLYASDRSVDVVESDLSSRLCGASRPGHFAGVCTVVLKLFHLVRPHAAVFGKKDYQQLAIIRRMVRDLNVPVVIHGAETVREPDGLAMSSRNLRLSAEERAQAPSLHATLLETAARIEKGESHGPSLRQHMQSLLRQKASRARIDYMEIVDRDSLQPLDTVRGAALLVAAVFFGKTRLIDNLEVSSPLS